MSAQAHLQILKLNDIIAAVRHYAICHITGIISGNYISVQRLWPLEPLNPEKLCGVALGGPQGRRLMIVM